MQRLGLGKVIGTVHLCFGCALPMQDFQRSSVPSVSTSNVVAEESLATGQELKRKILVLPVQGVLEGPQQAAFRRWILDGLQKSKAALLVVAIPELTDPPSLGVEGVVARAVQQSQIEGVLRPELIRNSSYLDQKGEQWTEFTYRLSFFSVNPFDEKSPVHADEVLIRVPTEKIKFVSESGEIVENFQTRMGALEDPVKALSEKFGPLALSKLGKSRWSGRIVLIDGNRLFLNAGRATGIQLGEIVKVLDRPLDVFDPQTGQLLGSVPGKVKGTLEVVDHFGQDGSIAIIHSGAGFEKNDKVTLF